MIQRCFLCALLFLTTCCGVHPDICTDDIECLWLTHFDDISSPNRLIIAKADWPIILNEVNRCRQSIGKYAPKASLFIKYKNGLTSRINLLSEDSRLCIGQGDSPFISNQPHPVLKRYLSILEKEQLK